MNSTAFALKLPTIAPATKVLPGTDPYAAFRNVSTLKGKNILSITDLTAEELALILEYASELKAHKHDRQQLSLAFCRSVAMLFEKPSLRTRVAFEVSMNQIGGNALYLEGKLGIRESLKDVAGNLSRFVDAIVARTFEHSTLATLASHASIPVINALSDLEHPCQAMADLLTIQEHKGKIAGLKIAYVGDCNNVANSLMLAAAKLGANVALACPASFCPNDDIVASAAQAASASGSHIQLMHDPLVAVSGADVVYTDTWVSMGQEEETAARQLAFEPYQVNATILNSAHSDAIVMHCLPAHRGQEITDEVIDGHQSVVLDQAENRLHTQKALLALVLN